MNNIDKQYQTLLQDILDNGVRKGDRTGTGTISVFGTQIRHKMSEGFPLLTTKKMAWKTMVTELLWFLRGDTNIKYLVENGCHIWDGDAYKNYLKYMWKITNLPVLTKEEFIERIKTDSDFAAKWGELGPIYGKQWRAWDTNERIVVGHNGLHNEFGTVVIDQIANLIRDLKANPDSRRLMVSAWNVGEIDDMVLPPCHYGFQVYTRELSHDERYELCAAQKSKMTAISEEDYINYNIPTRAISLMWNQRSVDTFLGLPFNIASYALLLEIIAKEVNMIPDELIGNLGDVHLYSNHVEQAKEQIGRAPMELPKLNFNTEWWDKPFFEAVKSDAFCKCLLEEDIQLSNYQSHPAIKAPLSN
jgi:thymidylate synthase